MDAFAVQQHLADWLNAAQVPGLDQVWPALPESTGLNFANYGSGTMRCQAVAYAESDDEIRRSGPGALAPNRPGQGMIWTTYTVRLEVCHRSAETDWVAADKALKSVIVPGIVAMIRKDPTLGSGQAPDPLFDSAGEGRFGIRKVYEAPFIEASDGEREQWAIVQFQVNAWSTA